MRVFEPLSGGWSHLTPHAFVCARTRCPFTLTPATLASRHPHVTRSVKGTRLLLIAEAAFNTRSVPAGFRPGPPSKFHSLPLQRQGRRTVPSYWSGWCLTTVVSSYYDALCAQRIRGHPHRVMPQSFGHALRRRNQCAMHSKPSTVPSSRAAMRTTL
jgi:hypothetical protein